MGLSCNRGSRKHAYRVNRYLAPRYSISKQARSEYPTGRFRSPSPRVLLTSGPCAWKPHRKKGWQTSVAVCGQRASIRSPCAVHRKCWGDSESRCKTREASIARSVESRDDTRKHIPATRSKSHSQLLDELHPAEGPLIASDVYPLLG